MRTGARAFVSLAVCCAAVTTSAQQATFVSFERVRALLMKPPPKLNVIYGQPDFSVHIQERRPLDDVFETPLWDTPQVVSTPGATLLAPIEGVPKSTPALFQVGVSPGGLARSIARKAQARSAKAQAERAIAQYCAGQPDRGLSIPLCWASSSLTP